MDELSDDENSSPPRCTALPCMHLLRFQRRQTSSKHLKSPLGSSVKRKKPPQKAARGWRRLFGWRKPPADADNPGQYSQLLTGLTELADAGEPTRTPQAYSGAPAGSRSAAGPSPALQSLLPFAPATNSCTQEEAHLAAGIIRSLGTPWAVHTFVPGLKRALQPIKILLDNPPVSYVYVAWAPLPLSAWQHGSKVVAAAPPDHPGQQLVVAKEVLLQPLQQQLLPPAELAALERVSGQPGCQQLLAWGVHGADTLLLVSPCYDCATLPAWLAPGSRVPARRVLAALCSAAGTMAEQHARGHIHGDLKPDNVLLDGATHTVIIDWHGMVCAGAPPPPSRSHNMVVLRPPELCFTVEYAGLEQVLAEAAAHGRNPGRCRNFAGRWGELQGLPGADREALLAAAAAGIGSGGCGYSCGAVGEEEGQEAPVRSFVTFASDVHALGRMLHEALFACELSGVAQALRGDLFLLAAGCMLPLPWERPSMRQLHSALRRALCKLPTE